MEDTDLIKKRLTEELTFLNGEVGRTKKIKEELEKDIENFELKRGEGEINFSSSLTQKESQLRRIDDQIVLDGNKLDEVKSEIIALDKELEDKKIELLDANVQLEKSIQANGDLIKKQQEAGISTASAIKSLEQAKKDVILIEKEIEAKNKVAKENEDRVNVLVETTANQAKALDIREKKLSDLEKENKQTFELNASRSSDLDKQAEALSIEKQKFSIEKVDSVNRDNGLKAKLAEIKSKEDALAVKEKDTQKREDASIIREQKSTLKEEELKIREKRISLKEQSV